MIPSAAYQTFTPFFHETVGNNADRPLFVSPDTGETISYGEVGRQATAVAGDLVARGYRGRRVVIAVPNSPEFFILFAGTILAGACPVLINPDSAAADLAISVEQTDAALVITPSERLPDSTQTGTPSLSTEALCSSTNTDPLPPAIESSDDIAYIIFSTGSTGRPKGCNTSHRNLIMETESMRRAHNLPDSCVYLCVLPVYHVSGLYRGLLIPFSHAAPIVLAREFDAEKFWPTIDRFAVGYVQVVPSVIAMLVDHPSMPTEKCRQSLVFIGSASAPLAPALQKRFEDRFGIPIAQGFGLTEATCGVCFNDPRLPSYRIGAAGRPIDIATVTVLDDDGEPLPAGKPGEIIVSGELIVEGYLDDIGKPIVDHTLYTGDIGYIDEAGYVFIESRKSEIIIRAGYKISPREIEDALLALDGVDFAVVFSVPHQTLGEDIIAYARCAADRMFDEAALRRGLAKTLPRYKVPTRVLKFDDSVLKVNFKAARGSLRNHYLAKRQHHADGRVDMLQPRHLPERPRAFVWDDVVYLRPVMEEDCESLDYIDNIQDPYVQGFTESGRFPQGNAAIRAHWDSVQPPDHMVFAICDRATDKHVGNIALRVDWVSRIGEIGRMIFRQYQDAPYSDHALELLLRYAFEELSLKRVWSGGANPASVPSLIRCGFQHEGTLRNHQFLRGGLRDIFIMGLLDNEYFARKDGHPTVPTQAQIPQSAAIAEMVFAAVAEAFDGDPAAITVETSPADLQTWDSIGMVILWNLLEERAAIEIEPSDMIGISCVGDLIEMIRRKTPVIASTE